MLEVGEVVAGRYRLAAGIGAGANGWVFRATHLTLHADVAIKLMRPGASDAARARFEREALLAARIQSDHVARVLDHGHHGDIPFIVIELLHGKTLRAVLDEAGKLGHAQTANMITDVCRGLSAAHRLGLVHRDIKPDNIFCRRGDEDDAERMVVLDFGVAKATESVDQAYPTQTGALVGTPYYASPEQARGLKDVGPAADLWSLAVVAFECLTGQRPFGGESLGPLVAAILSGAIPAPSELTDGVSPAVDAWFKTALARDPAARFGSARQMARTFAATLAHESAHEPPTAVTMQLVLRPGQADERIVVLSETMRIGRADTCEIAIAHHSLSREHAVITCSAEGVVSVRDLGAKNGTFVNDTRITGPHRLNPGDKLRCGALTFELMVANRPSTPQTLPLAVLDVIRRAFEATGAGVFCPVGDGYACVLGDAHLRPPPWLEPRLAIREGWMTAPLLDGEQSHGVLVVRPAIATDDQQLLEALATTLALVLSRDPSPASDQTADTLVTTS